MTLPSRSQPYLSSYAQEAIRSAIEGDAMGALRGLGGFRCFPAKYAERAYPDLRSPIEEGGDVL
jgi:hypothetical protein